MSFDKPDYERGNVRLWCCDNAKLLPLIPPGSVDAVVTDPPYGMNCNTDSTRFSGGIAPTGRRRGDGRNDWPEVRGDDKPFDPTPFLDFPAVVLWGCNHYANKLPIGTTLVWIKKADHLFGTFLSDCELAWMKGGHGVYAFRKQFPSFTRMQEHNETVAHPMQKPVKLMGWCIDKCKCPEGGTVFDPYMGSGSCGVACVQTGRAFMGCEIQEDYFRTAVRRIDKAFDDFALFEPVPPAKQLTLLGED